MAREIVFVVARATDGTIAKDGDVAEVAHSVEEERALCGTDDVAVIGGNDIFELFMPLATRLEITEIHEDTGGDVFMAAPGPEWREVSREEKPAAGNDPAHA